MNARSVDTDPQAERVQIALLRAAGPSRRAQMALSLSAQVITLARRAILRAAPEIGEEEASLRFVELQYGRELADGLRRRLAERR